MAYDALHAHPELHVYLLVTLGSALALPRSSLIACGCPEGRH